MFKLQRLEITGFKSFADYTEILFTGNGITAVVGPNGCGKSNVADAIAWVLGEQKAKSLRGEEMKDVVFQGSSKRSPGGMAEVVLHLVRDDEFVFVGDEEELYEIDETLSELDESAVDFEELENINSEANNFYQIEEVEKVQAAQVGSAQTVEKKIKTKRHWRPRTIALDFAPGEAVSVTRRLYRSGESEYQLNGKNCRLRDIQDLFSGTGLSGAHYALIEQGRIGQILSAKPSDRRSLIEEAAGISKFRTRQRAAEARLEASKTNLSRITDIVSEIEKQANSLRRQAAKTRRYRILREELRVLSRQVFAAEGKFLTDTAEFLKAKLQEAISEERRIFSQVSEKDEAFRQATQAAREAEENLVEVRKRHAENALRRDRDIREQQYRKEQILALKNRSEILRNESENIEKRLRLAKDEIKRLEIEEKSEREKAGRAELDLRKAEEIYRAKLDTQKEIENLLEKARGDFLGHTTSLERLAEIERHLENTIDRLKERAEGLRREGVRADENRIGHQKETENLRENLEKERRKLSALNSEKSELLEKAGKFRVSLQISEAAFNDLNKELSRTKNRLETLRELEEKRAVYAPQVQKLFAEQEQIGVRFAGVLADTFEISEASEKLIENLFGTYLQTVLVETESDALKTIQYLNENNLGRIPVLVLQNAPKILERKNEIHTAINKLSNRKISDLLGISNEFDLFLSEIFSREMTAEIIESFDGINFFPNKNFVNLDGDAIFGGKLFIGGNNFADGENSSLLAFKRELRELETKSLKLAEETEKAAKETEKVRNYLSEIENKIVDIQALTVRLEREILSLEIQEKSLVQEVERAERHKKIVAEETRQIEIEIAETQIKHKETGDQAQKVSKLLEETVVRVESFTQKLNKARLDLENENIVLSEKRTLAATSAERRRGAENSLRRVENQAKELTERRAQLNLEMLETANEIEALTASLNELQQRNSLAENEKSAEQKELEQETQNLQIMRENADACAGELSELNRLAAQARDERATLEIKQAENAALLKSLNEKCVSDLNVTLAELIDSDEQTEDFDFDSASRRAQDLRDKLENFGAINMLALEELAEIEERFLFLTSQRQDIIDGIAAAESALREIKERSREKFRQAFTVINANFSKIFTELFGGGKGEMTLIEAEDLLEAGIEVIAQPPGKRLQNILLLSGGEKAMAAIALIMAIFMYRPAPFCLLDEVDAPLDDANVGRFVNKITEMSEKTQFIVITHNKRTMEAARALYGVTMQEAGISKVVSVRFD